MYKTPYKNINANFENKDISGMDLSNEPLYKANLKNAICKGTDFSFSCLWGANLEGADLSTADITHTDLSYIIYDKHTIFPIKLLYFDLEDHKATYMRKEGLRHLEEGEKYKNTTLMHVIFSSNRYVQSDFSGTTFNLCVFTEADVCNSSFKNCVFNSTSLYGANCSRSDFSGADLSGNILFGTNLAGANLKGAKLDGGSIYPNTNLNNIKYDMHTVFDTDFDLDLHVKNFKEAISE